MDEIVKYSDIKKIDDIVKTFASIPIGITMQDNQPKFTIANYGEFRALIANLLSEYDKEIIITPNNLRIYEKEGASISNFMKTLTKSKKEFIKQFTDDLENEYKELKSMCEATYNKIHKETVAFRDNQKGKIIDVSNEDVKEVDTINVLVKCKKEDVVLLEEFARLHKMEILIKGE